MKTLTTTQQIRHLTQTLHKQNQPIALIPTMGNLHQGHTALIQHAKTNLPPNTHIILSIFINPLQFSPQEDYTQYPRTKKADLNLCRQHQVHTTYIPKPNHIYPTKPQPHSTYIHETTLTQTLEGASRPGHFQGVATIITILFNTIQPTHAIFGEKDWQQTQLIKKITHDLKYPIQILTQKTIREPDGLAISSRNTYLTPQQRPHANILWRAIQTARTHTRQSKQPTPAAPLKKTLTQLINNNPHTRLDYLQFIHPKTLQPTHNLTTKHRITLAAHIGNTRLIDNAKL